MSTQTALAVRSLSAPLFGVMTLSSGMSLGFMTVTLGYVLPQHGFSVAVVAAMIGLYTLPSAWIFLAGPVMDVSLTPRLWFMLMNGAAAICALIIAVTPLTLEAAPLLSALAFALGVTTYTARSANQAIVALTVPLGGRSVIAGWQQAGNLGGSGIGGGIGLWIADHADGASVAALALGGAILASTLPVLWTRTPPRTAGLGLTDQTRELVRALIELARTRHGVLAVIAVLLPMGLGAGASLLPAVADDWDASADLVATVSGVLGGLAAVPGCLIGGFLCARLQPRSVLMWAGLAYATGEASMALAPHTPTMFASFVLLNSLLLGVTWGAVTAVVLAALPAVGSATVSTTLSSLSNVPWVVVTMLVGLVQTRHGSTVMLLGEAVLGVVVIAGYALLAWMWKPAARTAVSGARAE